ncbi:MAG: hypothetical protein ABIY47_09970 [Opitutaceae bacterium]
MLPLQAAESALPVASANFSGGVALLKVTSATQAPQGRRFDAKVELQLEIASATTVDGASELPGEIYLDNTETPVLAIYVISGKNLAKTAYAWSVEGKTGRIVISGLDIGDPRLRLQGVDLELVLTKVTQWETVAFQADLGRSDFFQCGPFEFRALGEPRQIHVDAWTYPQFKAQHDAYRKRMPVTFLNHVFAMRHLKVVDADNRAPSSIGSSVPSVGAMTSTFSGFRSTGGRASFESESDDIKYPVSMTVRLPKLFESERIRFHFDVIPLTPPPEPPRSTRKR